MRVMLMIHATQDLRVTSISYTLYDDHSELVRSWVGHPEAEDCLPHAALGDLLSRLAESSTQIELFPYETP